MTQPPPSDPSISAPRDAPPSQDTLARGMSDFVWVKRGTPLLAYGLGLAGAVPMVAMSTALVAIPPGVDVPKLSMALLSYGAVTLAFIGAVHWGIALATGKASARARQWARWRLALSVVPALTGWAAMLVGIIAGPLWGLPVLIAGLALAAGVEALAARRNGLPAGYMSMRLLLTVIVEACLLAALLSRLS